MNDNHLYSKYLPMTETSCYILIALTTCRHGYAIVQYVKSITDHKITLGNGTLYGALSRMEKDGLIELTLDNEKRKSYKITELGRKILTIEKDRIKKIYQILEEVI